MANCLVGPCNKTDAKLCSICIESYCSNHMRLHKQHAYHRVNLSKKGIKPEDDPT